jgi:hypothetical protein
MRARARVLAMTIVALVVRSAMVRGHPHFAPRPACVMPAVNVP